MGVQVAPAHVGEGQPEVIEEVAGDGLGGDDDLLGGHVDGGRIGGRATHGAMASGQGGQRADEGIQTSSHGSSDGVMDGSPVPPVRR